MICPRCGYDNLPGNDDCTRCLLDLAQLDIPTGLDRVESSLICDHISALKPRAAATIHATATLKEVIAAMAENGESTLMVVNEEGKLFGLLSECDVIQAADESPREYLSRLAGQCMKPAPVSVTPDDSLARALQRMDVGGYRHLPVVVDGKPTGLISVHELVRHLTDLCKD